jgi:division protein CdvB (Snf7/Vps24/ESCRT-III family)
VDELNAKLEEVIRMCGKNTLNPDNDFERISKHFILQRNQIDLTTELLIEKVHEHNDKLMGEVNSYEKDVIESFKTR